MVALSVANQFCLIAKDSFEKGFIFQLKPEGLDLDRP